jgi:hypothetical protein
MKRTNAIIIVIIMIGGIFGTIGYLRLTAPPVCPKPPSSGTPITYGGIGTVTINNTPYWEYNVTFVSANESVDIQNYATFLATSFFDPNFPHLVGSACIAEPNAPFQATIRITFKNDGSSQDINFKYGGNPSVSPVNDYTVNHDPIAGVLWSQGDPFIRLVVSKA